MSAGVKFDINLIGKYEINYILIGYLFQI